jgi:phosphatidylinositol-3-phosphatase
MAALDARVTSTRVRLTVLAALTLATATSCGGGTTSAVRTKPRRVPEFRHVIVIVFENREADEVLGNAAAPTFNNLASNYATISRYTAIAHPSLPNYLALVSGSTQGIHNDCTDCLVRGESLADTLESAGMTWKTYAEGLPARGFTGEAYGRYVKRHDPFIYFRRNLTRSRLQRTVPLTQFTDDLNRRRLPTYSLVIPDLCHDMHDCDLATGDAWLATFLKPLLNAPALTGSVIFVTFDEGTTDEGGGGRVVALALGPLVRRGARTIRRTNHYGLLRTIEEGLGLPYLGRSAHVRPIVRIWR